MEKIKVVLCDDMRYLCQYFEILINREADMEVVGIAENSEECLALVREKKPDVVLLDIQMSTDDDGIIILENILKEEPDTKVIMLTIHEEDELIFRSLSLGACDYMLKSTEPENIIEAIRGAHEGRSMLNPCIAKKLLEECAKVRRQQHAAMSQLHSIALLTASEYKILRMIYDGNSYAEIAKQRFVEEVTIRTQVNKILKKFNASNMKQLVAQLRETQIFYFKI